MAEELHIPHSADRTARYAALLPQVEALTAAETDPVANMGNVAAVLREAFGFFWVGFYRVAGEELVLGPFQGPLACTRIRRGKGVCGTAWAERRSQLVPDVDAFPGHIACSSASKSELVVPIIDSAGDVRAVLDIDSDRLNDFSESDQTWLERWMQTLGERLY
ncbi:MAG TPA: GAF domain-containing protein [Candidatus Rikenella faecigallinarum]|uniref:GAF domain-containing protein n=1 Tax=Candidatus Rikenella faecigallinarum TaxID=2838745 RepID=A0A9D1QCN6_9BACT|nr:GAF domain-containing protein [Candidatus Rikenella faecigallinarum]